MAIPNFTSTEEALLKALAAQSQSGNIATMSAMLNLLVTYGTNFNSTPVVQTIEITGGIATIERRAIITYADLATQGDLASDVLDGISTTGFNRGTVVHQTR